MNDPAALQTRFQEALAAHQQGDLARAQGLYRGILAQWPDQADVLLLLGITHLQTQNYTEAAAVIARAVAANPANPGAWFNHGMALLHVQQYAGAADSFGRVIALQPDNPDAHNNRAIALRALGRHEEALAGYDQAVALRPDAPENHNNRAVTLGDLERHEEAAAACATAIALKPDYAEAHSNHGNALRMLRRYDEALVSFGRALALHPADAQVHNNRAMVYADLKQCDAALAGYAQAIALNPSYAEAFNNRANMFVELRQYDAALADYNKAVTLDPRYADAFVNLGHLQADMRRFEDAVASYQTARRIKPRSAFLDGHLLYTRMMNCDWRDIGADLAALKQRMARGDRATTPFPALVLTDDPELQRRAVGAWAQAMHPTRRDGRGIAVNAGGKIRVGYFSMDFRAHPISALTAGLFEAHDRERFEITAFSYGPDLQDDMRARLKRGFDQFVDVRTLPDSEVVALARHMRIDIAVDLAGYTKNARPGLFAARAAPIQVSYLGFPGTLAAAHIDYIIADETVIPPDARAHYTEKAVYLPHFQVNDDKRVKPAHGFSRAELGLPADGAVLCCFNNSYKFSPEMFTAWMRILNRAAGSVLFIYADSELAAANLRREAMARGVDPARLVFGKRLDMAGYLARYKAADLFLDTLPYNAGTTAADALWMGLPVLTCMGGAFAGRMAASLLHALDLPELITTKLQDYEERAVALATDAAQLAAVKEKLARNRETSALFNTAAFTRALENAYMQMCARARAGQSPDHIFVK
ncbi:MAG: tetratricopeptide repeat protein [Rhodospirillaceae bacterium]|nr:tetratricopeptide repeat protein [Rhodospirillaceae bacterium]